MKDRKIKFRAWDKTRKLFIDVPDLRDLLFGYGNNYDYTNGDDVEIMQYTGLKDRNGVEIYEGDLIENDVGRVCSVVWHEFRASFDCSFVSDNPDCAYKPMKDYGFAPALWSIKVKVIGNIHENPDLVKGE